jgi:peptide deformylase
MSPRASVSPRRRWGVRNLAVVDVDDNPMVIINPEVIAVEGKEKAEEGCCPFGCLR